MHEQQRKFFNDPRRHVLSLGVRHGRTQYGQEIKQAIEKQAEKRGEITEIAIDECKEMSLQDFEKIKDHPLLGKVELLSWSVTEHPLPGYEFTTVIKEVKTDE